MKRSDSSTQLSTEREDADLSHSSSSSVAEQSKQRERGASCDYRDEKWQHCRTEEVQHRPAVEVQ